MSEYSFVEKPFLDQLDALGWMVTDQGPGNLNFHWKCMMSPATILDYIVVHELAYLVFPDHSAKFWNEVD